MASVNRVSASFATAHGSAVGVATVARAPSTPHCASAKNPVDLVHLSKQSLGDRSLENEILRLFQSQSALYLDRLENATTADERKLAAHTVLGSARGLGAWKVAAAAEWVEAHCAAKCDVSELRLVLNEANDYISELLQDQ